MAGIKRLEDGKVFTVCFNRVREFENQTAAFGRQHLLPRRKSLAGRLHRTIYILGAGFGNLTQYAAIMRIHDGNTPAFDRIHELAVDEQPRFDIEFRGHFYTGCHKLLLTATKKITRGAALPSGLLTPRFRLPKTLPDKAATRPTNNAWVVIRRCFPKPPEWSAWENI